MSVIVEDNAIVEMVTDVDFLAELEKLAEKRYTEDDLEYMAVKNCPIGDPPILPSYPKQNYGEKNNRGRSHYNHSDRMSNSYTGNRGGNYGNRDGHRGNRGDRRSSYDNREFGYGSRSDHHGNRDGSPGNKDGNRDRSPGNKDGNNSNRDGYHGNYGNREGNPGYRGGNRDRREDRPSHNYSDQRNRSGDASNDRNAEDTNTAGRYGSHGAQRRELDVNYAGHSQRVDGDIDRQSGHANYSSPSRGGGSQAGNTGSNLRTDYSDNYESEKKRYKEKLL